MSDALLTIKDLRVYFHSVKGEYKIVDGVNLTVEHNEILGLAGESGSGKSTVIEAVMRLIKPPGYIAGGQLWFRPRPHPHPDAKDNPAYEARLAQGIDLVQVDEALLQYLRWRYISYIPQASMNALNPVLTIERQMTDAMLAHTSITVAQARERAAALLEIVGLPARTLQAYAHELSGGMKQRAIIASAMTLNPQLIIADEPTTALDVNVQRAILDALLQIKAETQASLLFVSHDLAVHAELVDRLAIMYAGKVVETSDIMRAFQTPLHPYSQRLIGSIPVMGGVRRRQETLTGQAPDRLNFPAGCRFHPRCPQMMPQCAQTEPDFIEHENGHDVACYLYDASSLPTSDDLQTKVDRQV